MRRKTEQNDTGQKIEKVKQRGTQQLNRSGGDREEQLGLCRNAPAFLGVIFHL
ncbi:hypothetical protein MC885_021274 [Smutsia gigantea]|nr:hypothetical protein MC885_021274 [Smutsia gigantea]